MNNWIIRSFQPDQDEHDKGGGASTSSASPAETTDAGAAAPAAPAQAGSTGAPATPEAGKGADAPAAGEQFELNWNGQKIAVKDRSEATALMQKGYDFTQKSQQLSVEKKELNRLKTELLAKHNRADYFMAELEKQTRAARGEQPGAGDENAQPAGEDKVAKLEQSLQELRDRYHEEQWGKIYTPIAQKFPDVPEDELASEFAKALEAGEVENTPAAVEQVAARLNEGHSGKINQRLEQLLGNSESPLVKAHNDKVTTAFLADEKNPKLAAFKQKVVADYLAEKEKTRNAGGEGGPGGGAGGAQDKNLTISQIAEKYKGDD